MDEDTFTDDVGCGCVVLFFAAFVILGVIYEAYKYSTR